MLLASSRKLILWLRKSLVSSLVFEITLVDTLHHFVKFCTVPPNSITSPITQNLKNNPIKLQGSQAQL